MCALKSAISNVVFASETFCMRERACVSVLFIQTQYIAFDIFDRVCSFCCVFGLICSRSQSSLSVFIGFSHSAPVKIHRNRSEAVEIDVQNSPLLRNQRKKKRTNEQAKWMTTEMNKNKNWQHKVVELEIRRAQTIPYEILKRDSERIIHIWYRSTYIYTYKFNKCNWIHTVAHAHTLFFWFDELSFDELSLAKPNPAQLSPIHHFKY